MKHLLLLILCVNLLIGCEQENLGEDLTSTEQQLLGTWVHVRTELGEIGQPPLNVTQPICADDAVTFTSDLTSTPYPSVPEAKFNMILELSCGHATTPWGVTGQSIITPGITYNIETLTADTLKYYQVSGSSTVFLYVFAKQ